MWLIEIKAVTLLNVNNPLKRSIILPWSSNIHSSFNTSLMTFSCFLKKVFLDWQEYIFCLTHLKFLLLTEISRVRKDMYNDTLNGSTEKRSAELPDAVGPIVQLQEKLYVPVKEYPDVSIFCCLFNCVFLLHILCE